MPSRQRKPSSAKPSRRSFLVWAGIAAVLAAVAEAIWVVLSFIRPRPARTQPRDARDAIVVAGPEETFPPGSVTAFPEGKFYLVRLEDGGFLALHRRCTHLGCTVPWDASAQVFACPCHSSAFDIRGAVLNPPAPRPLDHFSVRVENGIVKVDISKPIRRRAFEPSQVRRL
ncbi:MAG: Rieske (2Fe-2S) protein [Candidatus Latescibacterota bacterium]|nr:MAG: Rieske (2Fe-2S) protein [Candidatus Latescibacterota bacterium]